MNTNKLAPQITAVKRATVGLIGDGVKEISMDELESRINDQCDRINCYSPAWPTLIDILGDIGCLVISNDRVMLPVSLCK